MWAQNPYRPLVVGLTALFPTGAWGRSHSPFPQNGRAGISYGAYGAKEYYDPSGRFGWFVFFQAVSWEVDRQNLIQDLILQPLPDNADYTAYRLPFSNIGGLGLIYRYAPKNRWYFSLPVDVRITYTNYRQWVIVLPSQVSHSVRIESNSFLGFAVTPTFWIRLDQKKKMYVGLGLAYPMVWGKPAYYTIYTTHSDGGTQTVRREYYLPPQYVEFRMLVAFVP
ncbi:MAG: hypothetical protein N2200_02570 [Bacteroidia bacterium]|nr:hypothetical protein [Bacteroidia bacterium]